MTKVQFTHEKAALPKGGESEELRLIVTGHAQYAEKGRDIVCAAESILVQALACSLAAMEPQELYDFTVEGVAGSGCVGITAIPQPETAALVHGLYACALTGFGLLEKHYPANVSVCLGQAGGTAEEGERDER